ncbi:unnamed protein product [Adineta ricciae]|uniref:Uncharacterized protein n=1 Tax=Adineta ricciae TaxID=249248 RepID=A0A815TPI4_ADIRI|nr:unnamed protein product [Adineta ricciae]CAF1506702.1 unnamed protein product [Adineta ricciae]
MNNFSSEFNSGDLFDDENCLSQRLSQLSTSETQPATVKRSVSAMNIQRSPPSRTSSSSKKFKADRDQCERTAELNIDDIVVEEDVPSYLQLSSHRFRQLVDPFLLDTDDCLTIEDIQGIALLLRRIAIVNIRKSLWTVYLQAGTGILEVGEIFGSKVVTNQEISIWSSEVKSKVLTLENNNSSSNSTKKTTSDEPGIIQVNSDTCRNCVNQMLRQYSNQLVQYEEDFNNMKHVLNNLFTLQMESSLTEFIEQQELKYLRIEIEKKIVTVKYDYKDRFLQNRYEQYRPTRYERDIFDNMLRIKRAQLKSMYDASLWKQRRFYSHLPESLNLLNLPLLPSLSINTITDKSSRESLMDQYAQITQRTKLEIMALYIDIAQVKANENQRKLEQNVLLLESNSGIGDSMKFIIFQCFQIIEERFSYLYDLKVRALQLHKKTC